MILFINQFLFSYNEIWSKLTIWKGKPLLCLHICMVEITGQLVSPKPKSDDLIKMNFLVELKRPFLQLLTLDLTSRFCVDSDQIGQ